MNRLQQKYLEVVQPELIKKFNYTTVMNAPKLSKVVINLGVGDAVANPKVLDDAVNDLTQISGQKPIITRAKKSIATFKLREGNYNRNPKIFCKIFNIVGMGCNKKNTIYFN